MGATGPSAGGPARDGPSGGRPTASAATSRSTTPSPDTCSMATWADNPIRGPGDPALLVVLRLVTGGDYDAILYLQAFIGSMTVLPTSALARRLAGDGAGLIAAGGVALHWEPALGSAYLQSEVLFTPVLLLLLLLALRGFDRDDGGGSVRPWLAVGATLGVAAVTRSTMLPLGAVVWPRPRVWCGREAPPTTTSTAPGGATGRSGIASSTRT